MDFEQALALIRPFWTAPQLPFGSNGEAELARLEKEFGCTFAPELRSYLARFAPASDFSFQALGNPICLYRPPDISYRLDGYNWNPVTSQPIDDWLSSWFLIGDQGGDPLMVDLSAEGTISPVLQAEHGAGAWAFSSVADSIPQFLVLVAAQHHALTAFASRANALVFAGNDVRLMDAAADWYFPFLKEFAPGLYGRWTAGLSNA